MKTLELKKDFYWTGVQDPGLELFDIIIPTDAGSSYNSYLLKGSQNTALFETVKATFADEYMDKLSSLTEIKDIDYIVVNHTEPDHAGAAIRLLEANPDVTFVGSQMAIAFMKEILNRSINSLVVKDGDKLSLGDKTLKFINAPNLHWPDTIFTYIEEDKTLLTCDSFGAHFSFEEVLVSQIPAGEVYEKYMHEVKYYFDCILSPFKSYMLKAIEKISDLDIDMVCPGHGPVLDDNPRKIINITKEWSSEGSPFSAKTVIVPYVSAYGYTAGLAREIARGVADAGSINVILHDMTEDDEAKVLEEIRFADGVLFGTPTILGDAPEPVWNLVTALFPGESKGKVASAFGSFGWSGEGVPNIIARLKQLRMEVYEEGFKVRFNPSEAQLEYAYAFGKGFGEKVLSK